MNSEQIYDILRQVIDPEIGINVVDLGLVYDVESDDQHIAVDMTMTTAACPLGAYITNQAQIFLQRAFPEAEVTVNLVWEPAWNPEMMTDAAKKQLGWL